MRSCARPDTSWATEFWAFWCSSRCEIPTATELSPLLLRRWGTCLHDLWRMEWVLLGVGVTVITASLDEIHQSFIPSRTGRWQDVVLDTCGAAVLQIIIYFFSLQGAEPQARARWLSREFSSTS